MAAANATNQLFRFCEPADVADPEAFFAAVMQIFLEFPVEVMNLVADPARGISSRVRRPYLTDIRKACEDAYAPIERQLKRERVEADRKLMLPPPQAKKLTIGELEERLGRPFPKLREIPGHRFKNIDEAQANARRLRREAGETETGAP